MKIDRNVKVIKYGFTVIVLCLCYFMMKELYSLFSI